MSSCGNDWMMQRGRFLIDMQKTGPKLTIFHGFYGQNVKKFQPLDLKKWKTSFFAPVQLGWSKTFMWVCTGKKYKKLKKR